MRDVGGNYSYLQLSLSLQLNRVFASSVKEYTRWKQDRQEWEWQLFR